MTNPFAGLVALLREEPVQTNHVIVTGIALGSAFGLHLTAVQTAAIVAFAGAVSTLLTRRAVTPNAKLPADPQS